MTNLAVFIVLIVAYAVMITALWLIQKRKLKQHQHEHSPPNNTEQVKRSDQRSIDSTQHGASAAMLERAEIAQQFHQTFQKFVPRQFVDHFAKGNSGNLSLGYADEDDVSVMFCDIRGFTGLSEKMSPQELMNFLNSYFLRMNTPIHDNHGFIDKFIGDAIMALFDHPSGHASDKSSDSVKAALDLQKELRLYNHHRAKSGYSAVKNGIGLHYGPVIIGTVGSDDRMDTTVIGDTVNIAQRIEALTAYFDVEILASQKLVDEASKNMEFAHRYIDTVVLKGKTTSIDLIEIYHHLTQEEILARNKTSTIILEAVKLRNSLDFKGALNMLKKAQDISQCDPIIEYHINICNKVMFEVDWDKTIRL